MTMTRSDLTDREWALVAPHLPPERGRPGRPAMDNRQIMNGILWLLAREDAHWRALPERYGRWNTVWRRFSRWNRAGVFERLFAELAESDWANDRLRLLDSTALRPHRHVAKEGAGIRAVAASEGLVTRSARPRRQSPRVHP